MAIAGALIVAALPAPAAADPLQQQLVAAMRASDTRDIAFTRTTRIERTGAAATTFVARYDPAATPRFALVSVDGRAPTKKELDQSQKEKRPEGGYARLAEWFGAPATRIDGAGGRVTYRFARLPAGTFKLGSRDASADATAEALVETGGGRAFVRRVQFVMAKPVRMMLVAKVDRIVATSSYRLLADGRVFPAGIDTATTGSLMGKAGTLATHSRYDAVR